MTSSQYNIRVLSSKRHTFRQMTSVLLNCSSKNELNNFRTEKDFFVFACSFEETK